VCYAITPQFVGNHFFLENTSKAEFYREISVRWQSQQQCDYFKKQIADLAHF
jgi:hypothetical protein